MHTNRRTDEHGTARTGKGPDRMTVVEAMPASIFPPAAVRAAPLGLDGSSPSQRAECCRDEPGDPCFSDFGSSDHDEPPV